jgi:hypothetical protein
MDRATTAQNANKLSTLALRQWERALTGVLALPTAAALSTAATVLYAAALVERAFETLESAVSEVGRNIGQVENEGGRGIDRRPSEARS